MAGDSIDAVKRSQFLEQFTEKGVEVLYFVDPVDEYMAEQVRSFDSKRFKNIAQDRFGRPYNRKTDYYDTPGPGWYDVGGGAARSRPRPRAVRPERLRPHLHVAAQRLAGAPHQGHARPGSPQPGRVQRRALPGRPPTPSADASRQRQASTTSSPRQWSSRRAPMPNRTGRRPRPGSSASRPSARSGRTSSGPGRRPRFSRLEPAGGLRWPRMGFRASGAVFGPWGPQTQIQDEKLARMDPGRGPRTDFEQILPSPPPLDRFSGVPSSSDPPAASNPETQGVGQS